MDGSSWGTAPRHYESPEQATLVGLVAIYRLLVVLLSCVLLFLTIAMIGIIFGLGLLLNEGLLYAVSLPFIVFISGSFTLWLHKAREMRFVLLANQRATALHRARVKVGSLNFDEERFLEEWDRRNLLSGVSAEGD